MENRILNSIKMENGVVNIIHALQSKWEKYDWGANGITYAGISWNENNEIPKPTQAEFDTEINRLQAAYPLQELRKERDQLLAAADWTGLADSALTSETSAEWKLYRQRLRDLPKGLTTEFKVKNVAWPSPPG